MFISSLKNLYKNHNIIVFFILTVLSGLIYVWPLHDFQNYLSAGDHGRELYCFKKTMEGATPYRDYAWLFGPVMPYYYAGFMKAFGPTIQSVLLGQNILILSVGVLIYLIGSVFMYPALAYIAALFYWGYRDMEFFYSYDHVGGILMLLCAIYFLFRYIKENRNIHVLLGFLSLFIFTLIRLHTAVAAVTSFFLSLLLIDFIKQNPNRAKNRLGYLGLLGGTIFLSAAVYWLYVHPLPFYEIQQVFPYDKAHRADAPTSILGSIKLFIYMTIVTFKMTWLRPFFGFFIILAAGYCFYFLIIDRKSKPEKINAVLVLSSLLIFSGLLLHEFILSGMSFRLLWVFHIFIVLIFYLIYYFLEYGPKVIFTPLIVRLILVTMFATACFQIKNYILVINAFKLPSFCWQIGNNKVYATQRPDYYEAVYQTVGYLKNNVPAGAKIFTLPHDSLYYFLSERDAGSKELALFLHTRIPPEQENTIISDLEKNRVNWIVISNRAYSNDPGFGRFGQTHCRLLNDYIQKKFTLMAEFGRWDIEPGWGWDHGTRIYKRK